METVIKSEKIVVVTERNVEIIKDYSNGISTKDIADKYKISRRTVEQIMAKLKFQFDCDSLGHLVATFIRKGLMK